jgi:hypothetical protein
VQVCLIHIMSDSDVSFLQVRGTPGCGKSTLMSLLHSYILKINPNALVFTTISLPPPSHDSSNDLTLRLQAVDPSYPRRFGLTFLLFDEAQDSYEDAHLWNNFLKAVSDGNEPHYRVALFYSYGSPTERPVNHKIGVPLALNAAARVSLWPQPGVQPIGLLLNRNEFNQVLSLADRRPTHMDDTLSDFIFGSTKGHVGAVIQILNILSS